MKSAAKWKPKIALEEGWEPLGVYTRIGDCTVVIQRSGDWLEKGQFLKKVYWGVSSAFWERGGTCEDWKSAVKAAKWWAAELNHWEDEMRPKPRGRAPKCWVPGASVG